MPGADISYRFLFENLPAMVLSSDSEARFVNVSNIWLEKTGYTRAEVIGKSILEFAPFEFRDFFAQLRSDLTRDGFYNATYDMLRKDGTRLSVRASSVLVEHPSGRKKVSVTILQDIGEERRLSNEVEKQQIALISAARMASLGEMASGIAHEINNPLTIIHGKASQIRRFLLKASFNLGPVEEMLESIEKTCMRIATIIRSLHTFSRAGSSLPVMQAPVVSVIDDTLRLCQAMFRNHQIELRVGLIAPDLKIECRPADLSQALLNVLKDAFEAISKTEFAANDHERWISVDVETRFGQILIVVRNNGERITEKNRERIMTPFFTTKDVGGGNGLGLSVAKGLIESQGGRLFLDETEALTTFVIELPAYR